MAFADKLLTRRGRFMKRMTGRQGIGIMLANQLKPMQPAPRFSRTAAVKQQSPGGA